MNGKNPEWIKMRKRPLSQRLLYYDHQKLKNTLGIHYGYGNHIFSGVGLEE